MKYYVFGTEDGKTVLPLGYGAVYNHQDEPNVDYEISDDGHTMDLYAKRDLNRNEELFVSYGDTWFADRQDLVKIVV